MFEGDWMGLEQSRAAFEFAMGSECLQEFFDWQVGNLAQETMWEGLRRDEDPRDIPSCFQALQDWFLQSDPSLAAPPPVTAPPQPASPPPAVLRLPSSHAKQVGTLSLAERKVKIERYLEKRRRRSFHKKVVYLCRKRVADTRLRVKGRFVAKGVAESLQGLENAKNNVALPGEKQA